MLRNYSRIIAALGIIFPIMLAIAGIITAVKLESILIFVYFAAPAAVLCVILESYSALLETNAENQESIMQLLSIVKNNESQSTGRNKSGSSTATEFIAHTSAEGYDSRGRSIYADPKNPHILICPNCKARQNDSNSSCYQCSTPLR